MLLPGRGPIHLLYRAKLRDRQGADAPQVPQRFFETAASLLQFFIDR